jgi:predicted alpha/beta superfamily hydrolase
MARLAFILGLVSALALALYAGWRVHRWRQTEEEKRLRKIHTLTGNVWTYPDFYSDTLGGKRRVWVYLPPMYDEEPERRFPVLYMHDGQNVFDGATAFLAGKEWEADETAERLIEAGKIAPLIIVAVDNGGERRTDEYTPTPDRRGEGGHVDRYARMLVEELKPWVDGTFRTRPAREDTGIAGSSYGALASLWIGLTYTDVFGKIAALSTSALRDDGQIVRFVEGLAEKPSTLVWIDIGTEEARGAVRGARKLRDALVARGWVEGVDLAYVEAEGEPHNETAWARRLPAVLEFLFPPPGEDGEAPEGADG